VVTQVAIGRLFLRSSRISHPRSQDPFDAPKLGIRPPESAHSKGGRFEYSCHLTCYRTNFRDTH
jgi:hypothetical protein